MEVCSLHPTESQGYEMRVNPILDQITSIRKKSSNSSSKYLTPTPPQQSIVTDMKRTHSHSECDGNPKKTNPSSLRLSPSGPQKLKSNPSPNITTTDPNEFQSTCNNNTCEIFLGGSCNPTSWRKDIAIPFLKNFGISFFNPQVASWCPELVAAEHKAKEVSNVLFFVIDSETRAVSSLVEVAYLIAGGKNVILVINGAPRPGHEILGEPLSESEIEDLTCAQETLRVLASKHGIRVFDCIRTALDTTTTIIRTNENGSSANEILKPVISKDNSSRSIEPLPSLPEILPKSNNKTYDVFLGGGSTASDSWRNEVALPLFNKHGISSWSLGSKRNSSLFDDKRIESTNILFFYLGDTLRGLDTLILASYFVGLSRDVILCIENLSSDCTIEDEVLTETAIKDYNRGRSYLRDIAHRKDIPVYSILSEALDALVEKLKSKS